MDEQYRTEQAYHLLKLQRHRFLNHLQVIGGWLQMDRADLAYQFVESLFQQTKCDGGIYFQGSAELGLALIELSLEAEKMGVSIEWHFTEPVGSVAAEAAAAFLQEALARVKSRAMQSSEQRHLVISLGPQGYLSVHTPVGEGEG